MIYQTPPHKQDRNCNRIINNGHTQLNTPEVEIDISVWVWFVVPMTSHGNNACTRCEVSDVYSTSRALSMSTSQFQTQTMRRAGAILGSKDSLLGSFGLTIGHWHLLVLRFTSKNNLSGYKTTVTVDSLTWCSKQEQDNRKTL